MFKQETIICVSAFLISCATIYGALGFGSLAAIIVGFIALGGLLIYGFLNKMALNVVASILSAVPAMLVLQALNASRVAFMAKVAFISPLAIVGVQLLVFLSVYAVIYTFTSDMWKSYVASLFICCAIVLSPFLLQYNMSVAMGRTLLERQVNAIGLKLIKADDPDAWMFARD